MSAPKFLEFRVENPHELSEPRIAKIRMPRGAQIVDLFQGGGHRSSDRHDVYVCVFVSPTEPVVVRALQFIGTDETVNVPARARHVGSRRCYGFVWHVFDLGAFELEIAAAPPLDERVVASIVGTRPIVTHEPQRERELSTDERRPALRRFKKDERGNPRWAVKGTGVPVKDYGDRPVNRRGDTVSVYIDADGKKYDSDEVELLFEDE